MINLAVYIYIYTVLSHSVMSDSLQSHGLQPTRLLCLWGFSRQEYWSELPCLEIEPRSPTLQVDSSSSEPPGKPKNPGVGSLSLLQGIFPTQKLNWGLLHYRRILYQLSYQGSPINFEQSSVKLKTYTILLRDLQFILEAIVIWHLTQRKIM